MNSDPATANFHAAIEPLEFMEREAWLDSYQVGPNHDIAELKVKGERIGQVAALGMQLPIGIFNRALGLGIETPVTEVELDTVIAWMNRHCGKPWALPIAPAALHEEFQGWLAARGFTRGAGYSRFRHRLERIEPHPLSTTLEVREVEPARRADFGTVVHQGFGMPPSIAPWVVSRVGSPGWRVYLAYDGEAPVASGVVYIRGDQAWLGYGATLATHRGRGAQSSLLARRLADCKAAGVTSVTAETTHPPPGEEAAHISHRNLRRAGFELAYVRHNYLPPA
ncbi:MAG TPA: hypothetical protein VM689_16895 [Aliidongia sp.]|nr:hypothetical protein [Aliidongia sp.]